MRLEVIDRQRVQHAAVVAHLVLAVCWPANASPLSWSDVRPGLGAKPIVATVGHPTASGWIVAEHPELTAVVIDPDTHPRAAAAYSRFASIAGVTSDPVYVVMTAHLEPLAAFANPSEVPAVAARLKTDRESMVEEAGLAIRRSLISGPAPASEPRRELATILRSAQYDALGGGIFHGLRANGTPRFDKLLRDQVWVALEALATRTFETETRATLDYALAELRDESGTFVAGGRAHSLVPRDGAPVTIEGGHYQWTIPELRGLLGLRASDIVAFHYRLTDEGNFIPGYNIFLAPRDLSETAIRFTMPVEDVVPILAQARAVLYDVRSKRPDPRHHTAVITEYNAGMVSALARASIAFGEPRYRDEAVRTAQSLLKRNDRNKTLQRTDRVPALPEDFDALVRAMLDLYDATFDPQWIDRAIELQRRADASAIPADVPAFMRPLIPARVPETSSLVQLAAITRDSNWVRRAGDSFRRHRQIFVAGNPSRDDTQALVRAARRVAGEAMVFFAAGPRIRTRLASWMPYLPESPKDDAPAFAVVCIEGKCGSPIVDADSLARQ